MNDSISKDRSPRSPNSTLEDAIGLVRKLYDQIRSASVTQEVAVKPLGYGGPNGAALTTLATLIQYGLLARTGKTLAVTQLALQILHPTSPTQQANAIREAALKPKVMHELFEKFLECAPAVIEGHLIQNGFTPERAKRVAAIHVANKSFAKLLEGASVPHEPERTQSDQPEQLRTEGQLAHPAQPTAPANPTSLQREMPENHKMLAQYTIPLGSNQATLVFTGHQLTPDDFDALIDFVGFSKRQFERASKNAARVSPPIASSSWGTALKFPANAVWKNKDNDMPVTITGIAGERDGVVFYQSSTGTGIPASELEFEPSKNVEDY